MLETELKSRPEDAYERMDSLVATLYGIFGTLLHVLNQDGFVIFISGAKDQGKTNLALLLAEICWTLNFRRNIATNIWTESYMIQNKITDYDALQKWLESDHSRKLFILDELGKHLKKMRFMSEGNQLIMDTAQLIRHYDGGIIGIAPSEKLIDSLFLNTDILDARLYKQSRSVTKVKVVREPDPYTVLHTPATSIRYDSKDTAPFALHAPVSLNTLRRCCSVAKRYAETGSYSTIEKEFGMNRKTIRELLRRHIKHSLGLRVTSQRGGSTPQEK